MAIARIPNYLHKNPIFHLDAKAQQHPPIEGNGDERPFSINNIYNDNFAEQTTVSNQPIWRGDYWEFTGSELWNQQNFVEDPMAVSWFGVFPNGAQSGAGRIISHRAPSGNPFILLTVNNEDAQFYIRDSTSTYSNQLRFVGRDFTVPCIIGGTFKRDSERVLKHKLYIYRPSVGLETNDSNPSSYAGDFHSSVRGIGARPTPEFFGVYDMAELIQFDNFLSDAYIRNKLIPTLSQKWDI